MSSGGHPRVREVGTPDKTEIGDVSLVVVRKTRYDLDHYRKDFVCGQVILTVALRVE